MNIENDAHLKELCRKAAGEQDSDKLRELVLEINRLLDAKHQRQQNS